MIEKEQVPKPEVALVPMTIHNGEKILLSDLNYLDQEEVNALKSPTTQSLIIKSSQYIAQFISAFLYSKYIPEDQKKKTEILFLKIKNFFSYIREFAFMTGSELIYTTFLVHKLMKSGIEFQSEDKCRMIITEGNMGTVLICAVMLALKMLHDFIVYKNCWFAKAFGMSQELLNQSELAFFIQLDCNVAMDKKQFAKLYHQIQATSEICN